MLDRNEKHELGHQIGQIEIMVREMNLPPTETGHILVQMECLREAWIGENATQRASAARNRLAGQDETKPTRVAIHFDEDWSWTSYADDGVEVYIVCDATPSDRVYRMAPKMIPDGLIGNHVGHKDDGSSANTRAQRFVAEANGERHLRVVTPTPQSGGEGHPESN